MLPDDSLESTLDLLSWRPPDHRHTCRHLLYSLAADGRAPPHGSVSTPVDHNMSNVYGSNLTLLTEYNTKFQQHT